MIVRKCSALALALALTACQQPPITSYEECVEAGYPMMKSYPPKCTDGENMFVQDIGNAQEKSDLIRVKSPSPGRRVSQPFTITGEARGYWFFEGDFPVIIQIEGTNEQIATFAQADGEWMTEDFVPFTVTVDTELPSSGNGTIVLKKANASGLPENDDELRVPIRF